MRSTRSVVLCSLVLYTALGAGCGARRAPGATTAPSTETTTEATVAEVPCTRWDPTADPTLAPADVAAPPAPARRGADGLRFCILREGTGQERPTRSSRVRVHYTGWTTDGQMFDSSHSRGEPATLAVGEVIRGWTDALTHMTVGQVRRVWIPEELAYRGAEGAPAGMLVFDIELVAIEH
ncbi:MAG: FKBP-type peptidyl-prolyl cis-trans isomerase [Sandaracinaceae bacterium]|nr:FKBP-type peptidyl-prolyl cis-trans isomerase [Sandaracinaceae bacterium]